MPSTVPATYARDGRRCTDDADHDLVRKDGVYAQFGVTRRTHIDMRGRYNWWCRVDGRDMRDGAVAWQLDGWPVVTFDRAVLLRR